MARKLFVFIFWINSPAFNIFGCNTKRKICGKKVSVSDKYKKQQELAERLRQISSGELVLNSQEAKYVTVEEWAELGLSTSREYVSFNPLSSNSAQRRKKPKKK